MSTLPENEFDLEKLFLPAWAQQPSSVNRYAKFTGEEGRADRPADPRGRRGPGREGPRPRRDRPPRPDRPDRPDRPAGRPEEHRRRPWRDEAGAPRPEERREQREPPPPLLEVHVRLVPEEKGVEYLARQIKMTGRAYPLFDIAQMILQKPERHSAVLSVKRKPDGTVAQPLFACALDDTLWLSEDEVVAHVLRNHFATFYQAERTATEPPKGKYTFVAQCGLSGIIFGPPNYHDYQNRVRQVHAERFARMPFETYKARIRIVRDEAVVKQWVEEQSWRTEYVCLNVPEPLKLGSMEAVEQHFRATHAAAIVKPAETHRLPGTACRHLRCASLARLVRHAVEEQRRFPLQLATALSQQFASHGLQFFKVNKTVTHVAVARPHFLDLDATPVSEDVKRIVDYINANPKCTRRQLIEALAPTPPAPAPPPPPAPAEGAPDETSPAGAETTAAASTAAATSAPETRAPTPAQTEIIADLHWLIHQGHVIEFAKGLLEIARRPAPKPLKPAPKPAEKLSEPSPVAQAQAPTPLAPTDVAEPPPPESAAGCGEDTPPAPVGDLPAEPSPAAQPEATPPADATCDPPTAREPAPSSEASAAVPSTTTPPPA